jgi:hypothetical protein
MAAVRPASIAYVSRPWTDHAGLRVALGRDGLGETTSSLLGVEEHYGRSTIAFEGGKPAGAGEAGQLAGSRARSHAACGVRRTAGIRAAHHHRPWRHTAATGLMASELLAPAPPAPGPPATSTLPAMPSILPVVPSTLLPSEPSGGQVTALEEYNPCNTSTGDPYDVCKNYVNQRPDNDSIYPMRWDTVDSVSTHSRCTRFRPGDRRQDPRHHR